VVFNTSSPICGNAALRQALSGSLRIHDLIHSSIGRFGQPAEGLFPPGILGHDPGRRSYSLEPEKVTELLKSSGLSLPIKLQASVHPLLLDRYGSLTKALFKTWADIGV
jgi:hypothetical protein